MSSKKNARPQRRSLQFYVVHRNEKQTRVSSYDFFQNLKAGNLVQTPEQRKSTPTLAYVLPGLVAYLDPKTDVLTFEFAQRISVEEIEAQLINHFLSALTAQLAASGRLANLTGFEIRRLVLEFAHSLAVEIIRERDLAKMRAKAYRGLRSQWWNWIRHLILHGFLSIRQMDENQRAGLPLVLGEALIPGDRETAFALYR
jgi:hypothetical protein